MKFLDKKNLSLYIDKPFIIFEIENFLDNKDFDILKKTFPGTNYFQAKPDDSKEIFNKSHSDYSVFMKENEDWFNFFKKFESKDFVSNAYLFSLYENIKIRGLSHFKKWTTNQNNLFTKFFFRRVFLETHFALQDPTQIVYPHTDSRSKLLSMIYYVSGNENGGTEFWDIKKNRPKWDNWNNRHLIDKDDLNEFRNDSKLILKSKFKENKLVGFIKTNYSWHSVLDTGTVDETNQRKTVNLFYKI